MNILRTLIRHLALVLALAAPLCALATNSGEHRNLLPTEVVPWVG